MDLCNIAKERQRKKERQLVVRTAYDTGEDAGESYLEDNKVLPRHMLEDEKMSVSEARHKDATVCRVEGDAILPEVLEHRHTILGLFPKTLQGQHLTRRRNRPTTSEKRRTAS